MWQRDIHSGRIVLDPERTFDFCGTFTVSFQALERGRHAALLSTSQNMQWRWKGDNFGPRSAFTNFHLTLLWLAQGTGLLSGPLLHR
jgi:hypothetical protein